jgi:E3 ubiquitin-protein ligase HERC4
MAHDYAVWAQHGPSLRGSDPRQGWSFCSEPWLLSPQAKVRLLQVEAMNKMYHSQRQARHEAFNANLTRGGAGGATAAVAPAAASKRQRRAPFDGVASPSGRRRRRSLLAPGAQAPATHPDDPPPLPEPDAPFLILRVRREHLVEDTLDALAAQSIGSLLRPLRVVFEGEAGIDEGGVRKEFFQLLTEQLFGAEYGMFEWHDEARTYWFSRDAVGAHADDFKLVGIGA